MKSALILGSTGMLGYGLLSSIVKYNDVKVAATVRSKKVLNKIKKKYPYNQIKKYHILDVLKIEQKNLYELTSKYDYVINCIGIIKPQINITSAESIKNAIYINSVFPKMLSDTLLKKKIKIFQIATDCVFSGSKGNYDEKSIHDDTDLYGVSKSLGEIKNNNFYNLRTSIIGREFETKKSLLEWFLNNKNVSPLRGFENHYWNGLTTNAFGEIIYTLIKNKIEIPNTIHIVPKDIVNKYELLQIFNEKYNMKFKIKKFKTETKVDRSLNSIYSKKLKLIWESSFFKSQPKIKNMIDII